VAIEPFALERFTPRKPWLVLDKGPSFAVYDAELSRSHDVFALDHAMRGLRARVGHARDAGVLGELAPRELFGIEYLCMPWDPQLLSSPLAKTFAERGRLLSYNLSRPHDPTLPLVEGVSSGAAAATRLLAQSGAHAIRTLGVDLEADDARSAEIAATLNLYDVLCGPLDWELPAQVFVSATPGQELAYRVLEYSIWRHASISVQVERLDEALERRGIAVPAAAQRLAIPALRGNRGRAIYLESAMLVLRDIRALWSFDLDGRSVAMAGNQTGVMVFDCEAPQPDTPETRNPALPQAWNSLERYDRQATCLLQFAPSGPPWLDPLHPHAALWSRYLLEAVHSEHIEEDAVMEEVRKGHARASLLAQLERGEPDPRRLPFSVLRRDRGTLALLRGYLGMR
jgi:hypothetical protein